MKPHIHYCTTCHTYTLKTNCPTCNTPTIHNIPPRFSPQDPYGDYRRTLKKQTHHKETQHRTKK